MFGQRQTGLQKFEEILMTLRNGGTYRWIDWNFSNVDMQWLESVYQGLCAKGWSTYGGSGSIDKIFDKCKFPHSGYHMGSIVFLNKEIEKQVRAQL